MKTNHSVLISVFLFLILSVCVTANNIFINRVGDDLGRMREALPTAMTSDNAEAIRSLAVDMDTYWRKKRKWASLSVAESELDNLSGQIAFLLCAADTGNDTEYRKALLLFDLALDDICRLERFSIENIF